MLKSLIQNRIRVSSGPIKYNDYCAKKQPVNSPISLLFNDLATTSKGGGGGLVFKRKINCDGLEAIDFSPKRTTSTTPTTSPTPTTTTTPTRQAHTAFARIYPGLITLGARRAAPSRSFIGLTSGGFPFF